MNTTSRLTVVVAAVIFSSLSQADTIDVTPVMTGAYGGHTCAGDGVYYEWPSTAQSWGGCANDDANIYPLDFPNGGSLAITASAPNGGSCDVGFTAEATGGGGAAYTNASSVVTVTGTTASAYTLTFPAETDGVFASLIMSVKTPDCGVNISAMTLTHGPVEKSDEEKACEDTSVRRFEDAFGNTKVTCLTDTYEKPAGAESWGGFGDSKRSDDHFPFYFELGGSITFTGSASTPTTVQFQLENQPFPDNSTVYLTDPVTVSTEGTYIIDIPAPTASRLSEEQAATTWNNVVMYVAKEEASGGPVVVKDITFNQTRDFGKVTPVPALPLGGLLGLITLVAVWGARRRS